MDIGKVKKLREETGISLGECKKALEKAGGDLDKARKSLSVRKKKLAQKRKGRETGEGVIGSYIHSDKKVGVLVDLRSETDFVARSEKFEKLAHDLAMQVAALGPEFVSADDIKKGYFDEARQEWKKEFSGKPEEVVEKIIEGKIEKLKKEMCLLEQPFIKDEDRTVKEVLQSHVAEFGENIKVKRFVRYEI